MALNTFNDNLQVYAPKDVDNRKGKILNGKMIPYDSVEEALGDPKLRESGRFIGLTVNILKAGKITEYWFKNDLQTLVEKVEEKLPVFSNDIFIR